eukprot:428656_1
MNHSIMTYLAVATVIIMNTVNADGFENVFCENPWEQIGTDSLHVDFWWCDMMSDVTESGNGAIWWGSYTGPQYKFYNFEAYLDIHFDFFQENAPRGGFLFRVQDVSDCGGVTFGACNAYYIVFHSDNQIGLKGPGSTHTDGWLYGPQPLNNVGHYSRHFIRIDVIGETIIVKMDDNFQ